MATSGGKSSGDEIEIRSKVSWAGIAVFPADLLGKEGGHEVGELPPRLLGLAVEDIFYLLFVGNHEAQLVDAILEFLWDIGELAGNGELGGEVAEFPFQKLQSCGTELAEAVLGDGGRD